MTIEKAIEALEKEIGCLECEDEYCLNGFIVGCENNVGNSELIEAMKVAIKALKTINEDLIRRQDAIDAIERNAYRHTYIDQIVGIINELPSALPEPYREDKT